MCAPLPPANPRAAPSPSADSSFPQTFGFREADELLRSNSGCFAGDDKLARYCEVNSSGQRVCHYFLKRTEPVVGNWRLDTCDTFTCALGRQNLSCDDGPDKGFADCRDTCATSIFARYVRPDDDPGRCRHTTGAHYSCTRDPKLAGKLLGPTPGYDFALDLCGPVNFGSPNYPRINPECVGQWITRTRGRYDYDFLKQTSPQTCEWRGGAYGNIDFFVSRDVWCPERYDRKCELITRADGRSERCYRLSISLDKPCACPDTKRSGWERREVYCRSSRRATVTCQNTNHLEQDVDLPTPQTNDPSRDDIATGGCGEGEMVQPGQRKPAPGRRRLPRDSGDDAAVAALLQQSGHGSGGADRPRLAPQL